MPQAADLPALDALIRNRINLNATWSKAFFGSTIDLQRRLWLAAPLLAPAFTGTVPAVVPSVTPVIRRSKLSSNSCVPARPATSACWRGSSARA